MRKGLLESRAIMASNEVFKRLNILRRWSSFTADSRYDELSKQGLNCICAYILGTYSEKENIPIKWERFPRIALYRAFEKGYVYFDTPEIIINEICQMSGIPKSAFERVTCETISHEAGSEFSKFLSEGIGTYELSIYRAATKIATLVELVELSDSLRSFDYQSKLQEIYESLSEFSNIPGVQEMMDIRSTIFQTLRTIATLRNRIRWSTHCYTVECSVLGHLFDTACFAYFMSLEQAPDDEALAAKMFFCGVFHDVPECWTSDIPSPIKDSIPNFRSATEGYELFKLETELYSKLPDFVSDSIRKVMMEEESNKPYKKLLKGADYLSADAECWRQYVAGSRDTYFLEAIKRRLTKINSGEITLTPICRELYEYFLDYARNLHLPF